MLQLDSFKSDITIESPGRINLIGEHIDYNGGHVLPAAINKKIKLSLRKNNSNSCEILSANYDKSFRIQLDRLQNSEEEWQNYVIGVLHYINELKPNELKGFDCIIESDLPSGSGISSSAALECGIAKGVCELFKIKLTDFEIITLAQKAEHNFVGTKCGIMDQFAVVKGKDNHLILLNCDTIDYKMIEANFYPYKIVLLNTNVSHNLASSEYNVRREECNVALQTIQKKHPDYKNLSSIPINIVKSYSDVLPTNIYNRAYFVCEENQRTINAVKCLEDNNLLDFGRLMYKSHKGLQNLYKVSCPELDYLVESTQNLGYVLGSRMMGGGFGGCTINIVHEDNVEDFVSEMSKLYFEKFNIKLTSIITTISDGTKKV